MDEYIEDQNEAEDFANKIAGLNQNMIAHEYVNLVFDISAQFVNQKFRKYKQTDTHSQGSQVSSFIFRRKKVKVMTSWKKYSKNMKKILGVTLVYSNS